MLGAATGTFSRLTGFFHPSGQTTAGITPTAGSTPTATTPPVPTATATQSGTQPVSLHGSVVSVDQAHNSFVIQNFRGTYTIEVTSSTQYTGTASSLQQIQVGWDADVQGQQAGSTFVASNVNANPGDN